MGNEIKYDAFISYRHTELDKFVAENLHKQLESFRLPKSIAKRRPGMKNKIERVFRDKEELPLTSNLEDPILQALHGSEWLIVICSPRLRESMWCKKEIETFVKLRGRERVLAVLIEGEPAESFPEELLFKTEKHTLPDGTVEEIKIPVEPLAADVRGKNKKEVLKAMKTEILRLLAAMFQLNYDDLRQRHKEQRMRRIVTASLIGGAACLAFGVYSTATALRIQKQKEQIEIQAEEIKTQSDEIKAQSEEIQKQNDELSLRQARSLAELATQYLEDGDRANAITTAVEALTESDGIAMPYTPEAQMILAESVRAYDTGNAYKAEYQYHTAGKVDGMIISGDQDTLCIYDDTQTIRLFDMVNLEVVKTLYSTEYNASGIYGCSFLGDDRFVYLSKDDKLCVYDLNTKEVVNQVDADWVLSVTTDDEGKYIALEKLNRSFDIYDGKTLEKLGTTPTVETGSLTLGPYVSEEGVLACAYPVEKKDDVPYYTIYYFDLNTMEVLSTYDAGVGKLADMEMKDGIAYMAIGEYEEHYSSGDAFVIAMDIATGKVIWKHEQPNHYPRIVKTPANEGATKMLFISNANAVLLDIETGEVHFEEPLNAEIANAYVYANDNSYLLYSEVGGMFAIRGGDNKCYDMSHMFECKTQTNEEVFHSQYGLAVWARNDNKITIYTNVAGRDVVSIEEEHSLPTETEKVEGDNAAEIARSYELDNPDFVSYLFYSEDGKYCFVKYFNSDFIIYDVAAGKVRTTMEEAYPANWYLTADAEGYSYLLGYQGCYVLDADMKPVMFIPKATQIDKENRKVYMKSSSQNYEAPLYNVMELIEMAKSYNQAE